MSKTKHPCIIITTIHGSSHPVLQTYNRGCGEKGFDLIIAGDKKTPTDFHLSNATYLSLQTQAKLKFSLANKIPDHSYAKKNLAYLVAIQKGHQVLIETDDDNHPLAAFWKKRDQQITGTYLEQKGWVNVYAHFSDTDVWPRGFHLGALRPQQHLANGPTTSKWCPVQQSLANENPDIDAIYRLTRTLPLKFKPNSPILLGNGSICPFNSQNTTWFQPAFALLYLPSFCEFRMTDIWRSLIAQRIFWENGWSISYHSPTVKQKRNPHDLFLDFEQEIGGYVYNGSMMEVLCALQLKKGKEHIPYNLKTCYKALVEKGYMHKKELELLSCWLKDIKSLRIPNG